MAIRKRNSSATRSRRNGPTRPARPAASLHHRRQPATMALRPDAMFDAICTAAQPTGTAWRIIHKAARRAAPTPHLPARARPAADTRETQERCNGAMSTRAARGGLDRVPARVETWGDLRAERERPYPQRRAAGSHQVACGQTAGCLASSARRRVHVPCPGQRHGANGHLRVDYESVLQFRRDR